VSKKRMLALYMASALAIGGCSEAKDDNLLTQQKTNIELGFSDYLVMAGLFVSGVWVGKVCYQHAQVRSGKKDAYEM
jgi:hypothetical protein